MLSNSPSALDRTAWMDRCTGWCMLIYLVLLLLLFHRLFVGEVLRPGAVLNKSAPFVNQQATDVRPYINAIQYDVWRMMACYQQYQYDSAQEGRFPTWNPHIFTGFAFHANGQSAMLHPFHWAYFLIPPNQARGPLAILRLWIAAVATFYLLRHLGMSIVPAFAGGLVWMLCTFNIRWLLWTMSNTTIWLPVLLLALDVYMLSPGRRSFASAVLAATVHQLSGHPESQFLTGATAGLFVWMRLWSLDIDWKSWFLRLCGCLFAMVLGVAGAAVSLLPFLIQMVHSADWHEVLHQTPELLPLRGLLLLVAPDHFGRTLAGFEYHGPSNYCEASLWFATLPLAMIAATVLWTMLFSWKVDRQQRFVPRFASVLFVIALTIVFDAKVVTEFVHRLPLFGQSNNLRLVFAVQFAGALATGYAFERILVQRDRSFRWMVAACMLGIVAILGWLVATDHLGELSSAWQVLEPGVTIHHPSVRTVGTFLLALASLIAILVSRRGYVAAACIGLDLLWVAWGFNPIAPESLCDPPAPPALANVIQLAGDGRIVGMDEVLVPNLSMRYGFRDLRGYDFPLPRRLFSLLHRIGIDPHWTIMPSGLFFPQMTDALAAMLDRCSIRYVYGYVRHATITRQSGERDGFRPWLLISANEPVDSIYFNPNAYPRAWWAKSYRVTDRAEALNCLLDYSRDLRQESVIEVDDDSMSVATSHEQTNGAVEIVSDEPERVVLRCQSSTGGLVVLSDRMDWGWMVRIDGKPGQAVHANYLFRGVIVPPGEHEIVWEYRCPGLVTGVWVSGVTLGFCLVLLVWPSRRLAEV